jgi:glycosyltransferase involved in cell wall biosynthesis
VNLRVVVATVVHHPQDARISSRQLPALLEAGHRVVFIAPWRATGTVPPPSIRAVDVPRAVDRRRVAALVAARREMRRWSRHADVLLVHDPELLTVAPRAYRWRGEHLVRVWDVHEDTEAALTLKPWLPAALRPAVRLVVRVGEGLARRRWRLLLAEEAYRERFGPLHPVVPNTTVPPPTVAETGNDRVVYVGALSRARGAEELIALGRLLRPHGIRVELVGAADTRTRPQLEQAVAEGAVRWHGLLPHAEALAVVDGALAGLSLLRDEPNYRHSQPTKIIEYMAHGVPVITTPLPRARDLVTAAACGIVVPFQNPPAAAAAARWLAAAPVRRQALADAGRTVALREHDWRPDGALFVRTLQAWVADGRRT